MIGRTKLLLYNPNLGASVSELRIRVTGERGDARLTWTKTSKIRPNDKLASNAHLILTEYVDPLADRLGFRQPCFHVSIQKTPHHVFRGSEQVVSDTSAGVGILVGMVSALLKIPISPSIATTGGVEPPHANIGLVAGIGDKVKAALNWELIERIAIPDPDSQYRGLSDHAVDADNYRQQIRSLSQWADKLLPVQSIDDLWPAVFPVEQAYEALMPSQVIYEACRHMPVSATYTGLLRYLRGIYEERWGHLTKLFESATTAQRKSLFQSLTRFYLTNAINPEDFSARLQRIVEKFHLDKDELHVPASIIQLTGEKAFWI